MVVDFFKYVIGEVNAVDAPPPEVSAVRKILVLSLEKTKIDPVMEARHAAAIDAKEDAIRIRQEALARGIWLPTQFVQPGTEFDVKVWLSVQKRPNFGKIFGTVGDVQPNESCVRMTRDDCVSLLQQSVLRREILALKMPGWMTAQRNMLLVVLV